MCVENNLSENYLLTIRIFFFLNSLIPRLVSVVSFIFFFTSLCPMLAATNCNVLIADVNLALGCPQIVTSTFFLSSYSLYVSSVARRIFELKSIASVSAEKDFEW